MAACFWEVPQIVSAKARTQLQEQNIIDSFVLPIKMLSDLIDYLFCDQNTLFFAVELMGIQVEVTEFEYFYS